jgi:replicative DNA helicase
MAVFNPEISGNSLPPQNIEAEELILGGILLDPEAMGQVVDILIPAAFYVKAHQEIYSAALILHAQGKPTDLMAVTVWLADRNELDKVGGNAKLAGLLNRTVSAANIDRYARLIMDKYIRRELIAAGHEIVELGYETAEELETVLDESEQKIFRLTQEKPQQGLVPIADTLIQTFNELENLHQQTSMPGIPCGFYDLDAMTSGFGRSDLIIVAGRPSMGKCLAADSEIVLADGSVATIAEIYQRQQAKILTLKDNWKFATIEPSAFIDDSIKPVFRVITRLGRAIETTVTHPYLTIQGWKKLSELNTGDKIAVPRIINIFGEKEIYEDKVKLLAYLIGDGSITTSSPRFTNTNPKLQEEFIQAVKIFPSIKVKIYANNRAPSLYVTKDLNYIVTQRQIFSKNLTKVINSQSNSARQIARSIGVSPSLMCLWMKGNCVPKLEKFLQLSQFLDIEPIKLAPHGITQIQKNNKNSLAVWLEEIGIFGKKAEDKFIPSIIFELQRSLVALFLNRLFATDGWATALTSGQSQIGYATVSEKLARQIQHLLLRFGVIASLKKRSVKYKNTRRNAWQLDITDSISIKSFIDEIGIFGKEEAIEAVKAALTKRKYQTNRDLIPVAIWEKIAAAKGNRYWKDVAIAAGIKGYSNIHVGKRALSRERLFQLASALEDLSLQQLANSEVYWDEIVSIAYVGNKQVYDLTIPDTHNFVANDICVHNTSFALNIACNIAQVHRYPVAIFSLEMSKEQLAQRLLAGEAKIESNRLRSGRFSQNEYEPLVSAVAQLSDLPIFIDDTASLSVTQMRSQLRRLQSQHKGQMGLVLLDYLQLMEGGGDNRVQELSKITRSLKGLAREFNVPIIALSQLSRGVEQRTNKRPMMSDLRESGCLSGETLVTLADTGKEVPIQDLVGKSGFTVWSLNQTTMQIEKGIVSKAFCTGIKPVYKMTTRLGRTIRATGNHKFLSINGWKRLDELRQGERLALPRYIASQSLQTMSDAELALLAHLIGDGCTLPRQTIQYTTKEEDLANLVRSLAERVFGDLINPSLLGTAYCGTSIYKSNLSRERAASLAIAVQSEEIERLACSDLYWDEIRSIAIDGETEVYDLTVSIHHNFIANNIVVHNSIEQDADLIIMLYRDSYYNPDSPDRNIAEVIIVKHRNGPTGTVKLLFQPELTKFENLAQSTRY